MYQKINLFKILGNFSKEEATRLMKMCINYYMSETDFQWVRTFNQDPNNFDFDKYSKEVLEKSIE